MKRFLLILLLLPVLGICPEDQSIGEETAELTGVRILEEELDESNRELCGSLRLDGEYDAQGAVLRLWKRLWEKGKEQLRTEFGVFASLVGIAYFSALAASVCQDKRLPRYAELAACCAASLLLAGTAGGVMDDAVDSLWTLTDYSKASMPAFFSAVAASGAAVSASVKYASVVFAMDLFMDVSQKLILPLIRAFLAVSVASSLFENPVLTTVCKITKWCAVTAMTLMSSGFCLFISLSGLIGSSADAAAVKSAKTVISTALPVVGGILSDSASSLLAAAQLVKNSAGVFGLIAVCALCVAPFAELGVKTLVYKAASTLSDLGLGGKYSQLLGRFGTAFGMLLGLVGSYGMMLFISLMSGIRMVTG